LRPKFRIFSDNPWQEFLGVCWHTVKLEAWMEECAQLVEGGTRKKDLSPKPKLGKKPQLPVLNDDEDEVEEEPMDDGDM
jgi:hypothetical protein